MGLAGRRLQFRDSAGVRHVQLPTLSLASARVYIVGPHACSYGSSAGRGRVVLSLAKIFGALCSTDSLAGRCRRRLWSVVVMWIFEITLWKC